MTSRTEKKIEKELDRAEKHHDKATIAEAKGHLHSADRHENTAAKHEAKAENLAHNIAGGLPAGGITPYSGLGVPLTGAAAHPTYGYMRLPRDKKAERFEAKAVEWERRGNTTKAQKNRQKALRHRQRLQPGYTPIAHPQPYYVDKANRFDQRSSRYQQLGLTQQAQRYQQRALRTRTKHNVSGPLIGGGALPTAATLGHGHTGTGLGHTGTGLGHTGVGHQSSSGAYVGPIVPVGGLVYKGLDHPMTGSTQHPTFGYSKLTSAQKAQRFDQKAAEWDKRGNSLKAQKNREKANRYRQMNQAGYVKPTRAQSHYVSRAQHFDQKAIHYQQMGRSDKALRSQQRAQRIRTKHSIPLAGAGLAGAGLAGGSLNKYQGLNFPYSGASAHPNYGYQRLPRDQKALRFEQKAAEWERRGNTMKAQKNRDKANRYRQMSQPGYVRPTRPQNYYTDRAHLFDQKAARYQQLGMGPQAQRYQGRSQRIRAKHNIPLAGAGLGGAGLAGMGANRSLSGPYQGLNFPYNGASAHPAYGYQRLPRDQKALRFEQKAAEWERRGNLSKAQKNREKANRLRQKTQPGYVRPNRPQNYYNDRALLFDQKAARYHQLGMAPQAQRYQGRSQRIRAKHNIPLAAGTGLGAHHGSTWTTGQTQVSPLYPAGATYQGLNFPYSGASAHPNYGYQRLPHNKKAERYNLKAAEWERKGNLRKAQKNREKANRYLARSQPGYVRPTRPQNYYVDRANVFDQKANQYQQWGMQPQAQRYQGRSQRVRAKHNIPLAAGTGLGAHHGSTWTTGQTQVSPLYPAGATYQGLSFPYTGASAHPTYGYQRLPRDRKAERFEAKAAEWERRGNLKKSQKNRDKALRIRQKSAPGYVRQQQPQGYYVNRANIFDQKANQYQQWGMQPQAQRYQQRATRVRGKHNLPASAPLYTANAPLYTAARV